jgi:hypothetical protein
MYAVLHTGTLPPQFVVLGKLDLCDHRDVTGNILLLIHTV